MIKKNQVMDFLKLVMDPELHINIVDLGLIYNVIIKSQMTNLKRIQTVKIEMTLTTPGCPLAPIIDRMIKEALEPLDIDVELELIWDPPWTKDMMSEEAKLKLGMI